MPPKLTNQQIKNRVRDLMNSLQGHNLAADELCRKIFRDEEIYAYCIEEGINSEEGFKHSFFETIYEEFNRERCDLISNIAEYLISKPGADKISQKIKAKYKAACKNLGLLNNIRVLNIYIENAKQEVVKRIAQSNSVKNDTAEEDGNMDSGVSQIDLAELKNVSGNDDLPSNYPDIDVEKPVPSVSITEFDIDETVTPGIVIPDIEKPVITGINAVELDFGAPDAINIDTSDLNNVDIPDRDATKKSKSKQVGKFWAVFYFLYVIFIVCLTPLYITFLGNEFSKSYDAFDWFMISSLIGTIIAIFTSREIAIGFWGEYKYPMNIVLAGLTIAFFFLSFFVDIDGRGVTEYVEANRRNTTTYFRPSAPFEYFFNNIQINKDYEDSTASIDLSRIISKKNRSIDFNITIIDRTLSGAADGYIKKITSADKQKLKESLGIGLMDDADSTLFNFQDYFSFFINNQNKVQHKNLTIIFNGVNEPYFLNDSCHDDIACQKNYLKNYKDTIEKSNFSSDSAKKRNNFGRSDFAVFFEKSKKEILKKIKPGQKKIIVNIISDFCHEVGDRKKPDQYVPFSSVENKFASFLDSMGHSLSQLNLYKIPQKSIEKNDTIDFLLKKLLSYSLKPIRLYDLEYLISYENSLLTPGLFSPYAYESENSNQILKFKRSDISNVFTGTILFQQDFIEGDSLAVALIDKQELRKIPTSAYHLEYFINSNEKSVTKSINDVLAFASNNLKVWIKIKLDKNHYTNDPNDYLFEIYSKKNGKKFVFPVSFYTSSPNNINLFFLAVLIFVTVVVAFSLFIVPHNGMLESAFSYCSMSYKEVRVGRNYTLFSNIVIKLSFLGLIFYFVVFAIIFLRLMIVNNITILTEGIYLPLVFAMIFLLIQFFKKKKQNILYLKNLEITKREQISKIRIISWILFTKES